MQKLTATAGRRPIPKIVPDTVVDHVEDEATQFDPRLYCEDEATEFAPQSYDDEATQFEPCRSPARATAPARATVGATIRPSRPSTAKAPARFALGTERVPRLPPPPPAPPRATLPRPRVAREPAANTPPSSPLPVATPLPSPRPMVTPMVAPIAVADMQALMSSRDVGAFSTARVLRAIPMLVASTAPADIVFSSPRGVETERVVPRVPRRRLAIAIGVAAASLIGVVLGLLLIGNDDAAPRIATISKPVVTPIVEAPVVEHAAPAPEPAVIEADTTIARPEPSTKRPKAKKVAHPPRRRPFSVDTSTPLGTLRVTRS